MEKLLLTEVIAATGAGCPGGLPSGLTVTGVSTDTRSIRAGDLFIALKGDNYDGNDFIALAESKGACAVIASRSVCAGIPVLLVDDTLKALQNIAKVYRTKFNIPVIAVTGSNGKTTTKNMLATILSSKYKVYFSDKNFNNQIGLPKSILELDASYGVAVFELGMNHAGEIGTLSRILQPDAAVITNIGKAHIGPLGSVENICRAKLEITEGLKPGGKLILNSDDPMLRDTCPEGFETVYAGISDSARNFFAVRNIRTGGAPVEFDLSRGTEHLHCQLPTLGLHNIVNALLAVCCAAQFGIDIDTAVSELSRFTVASMRDEITNIKGVTIIKDYYNASPDSVRAALETLSDYRTTGRRIVILGQMSELGEYSAQEHAAVAKLCAALKFDRVFFVGGSSEDFLDAIGTSVPCACFETKKGLIAALKRFVAEGYLDSGDVVLIKGSREIKLEEVYESLKSFINARYGEFISLPPSQTRLYIDISAIKYNYQQLRKAVGGKIQIVPMVKANAYGCGVDIIANIFRGCEYLAVADIKEAALLRRVLPEANILIIYQPTFGDIPEIVENGYIAAVSNPQFAQELNAQAAQQAKKLKIHVEIDTGFSRLGLGIAECTDFARLLLGLPNLEVEGLFMHYACADSYESSDLEYTRLQTERFDEAIALIEGELGPVRFKHACAGAGIFNPMAKRYDMVRPGYMLYGYYPSPEMADKVYLKPALKFASVILQIKDRDAGTPISYNRRFVTNRKSKIATVAVGYADGVPRMLTNRGMFVVNGQLAPVVGTICMDLTMIDITDISGDVRVGDEVFIFDNTNVTLEGIAEQCRTIGYEIIAQLEDKADRIESF